MAETKSTGSAIAFRPYVPAETSMTEFSVRALLIGLSCASFSALRMHTSIESRHDDRRDIPGCVIGMALLRLMKGSILKELCPYCGSIGESVAAGAIFTIPAFFYRRDMARLCDRRPLSYLHRHHVRPEVFWNYVRCTTSPCNG